MPWQEFRSHVRHLTTTELVRTERAYEMGKSAHAGQRRKSGEPYFSHPIAVAHMLSDLGADADTIIAALLHDTIEDTTIELSDIDREFGGSVAMLIDGVTKLGAEDVAMSPRLDEQMETLRKIFTLMQKDVRIMVIKLVDRLHNMQTVEFLPPERQRSLAQETLEVFVKIADKLCMQDLRDELEALCLSILEPETFERLLRLRVTNEQRGNTLIETMQKSIRTHDRQHSYRTDLSFEHKTWEQLKSQLSVGESVATGLSTFTVAFVSEDVDKCYQTLGALHQLWKRETLSFQDFINAPQLNGYRGLHTTIILQDGTRVRCKIRTREMQEYARKGVASVCFDGETDIREILPWTKRLTPLTTDTEGSSNDFWQSLQSDILGDSITIHGPDDATVQLPRDATALDGAFYLIQENALRLQSVRINGSEAALNTELPNAASLDVVLADHETVKRDWLRSVRTAFSAAQIRAALMKTNQEDKIGIGREMLQKIFTDRKRGFIEEFEERELSHRFLSLGYHSLSEIYVAIADGRIEPLKAYTTMFENGEQETEKKEPKAILHYSVNMDIVNVMDRVNFVHRKYGSSLSDIRYKRMENGEANVTLHVHMPSQELSAFQQDLATAGANDISIIRKNARLFGLIAMIIVLWGLNPVVATWFLEKGMTPLSLVTVRFFTFFVYTTGFYGIWRLFSRTRYTPIRQLLLPTALPASGLMGMSLFNYFALVSVPPSLHLTILRLNTLLLPVILSLRKKNLSKQSLLIAIGLFVIILILVFEIPDAPPSMGILFSLLALGSYTLYSLTSEHVLQVKHISVRYPAFAMNLGLLLGIAGLILLPFQTVEQLLNPFTLPAILYVLACVCIPHMFYSMLLKQVSFRYFTDIFILEVPFAIGFEILLLGLHLPTSMYVIIAAIVTVLLVHRWKSIELF